MEFAKPQMQLHANLALEGEVLYKLWQEALTTLQSLQSPLGVTASGPNDQFHAIFGRDSLWTVLLALEAGRLLKRSHTPLHQDTHEGCLYHGRRGPASTFAQSGGTLDGNPEVGSELAHTLTFTTRGEIPTPSLGLDTSGPYTDPQLLQGLRQEYRDVEAYQNWLHDLSGSVLRGLAQLQGKRVNDVNEEQPGRIVHEYWDPIPERMLLARWPVTDGGYFGAFDATFLYMIAVAEVVEYFDDEALLEELWPHVQAVLHWMLEWSDLDGDGLVEYKRRNPEGIGLANQVWKDSGESLQTGNHQPVVHPVAWIEVQGYAWAAYAAYIELARRRQCLHGSLQQELQQRMDDLQQGLERFWLEHEQYPAIALDGQKKPIAVVASNPGHLLWSGCLEQGRAEQIGRRLMQSDLLTMWGLRTLSEHAYYYNPLMYHCGAIWPFDNAVIAVGLRRYGCTQEARRVAESVMQALVAFNNPVELYTVQPSRWIRSHRIEQEWFLADYFYACSVQAWTAAAVLYFVAMLISEETFLQRSFK